MGVELHAEIYLAGNISAGVDWYVSAIVSISRLLVRGTAIGRRPVNMTAVAFAMPQLT